MTSKVVLGQDKTKVESFILTHKNKLSNYIKLDYLDTFGSTFDKLSKNGFANRSFWMGNDYFDIDLKDHEIIALFQMFHAKIYIVDKISQDTKNMIQFIRDHKECLPSVEIVDMKQFYVSKNIKELVND